MFRENFPGPFHPWPGRDIFALNARVDIFIAMNDAVANHSSLDASFFTQVPNLTAHRNHRLVVG